MKTNKGYALCYADSIVGYPRLINWEERISHTLFGHEFHFFTIDTQRNCGCPHYLLKWLKNKNHLNKISL